MNHAADNTRVTQPTENTKAATGASVAANGIHISKAVDIPPLKPEDTVQPLKLQTTDEIEKSQLTAPPFVIDDLLVAGLTVLAAPPKIGKSWFCLDMGTCIAEGRSFLGRSTHQGDVLYLDLESRDYRVQNRMKTAALRGSKHLHIAFKASTLGDGNLLTQITQVHAQIPQLNTVIIDTLGRAKGEQRRNLDAYSADTKMLAPLQEWALSNGIAVIAVTHERKLNGKTADSLDDPFEVITGSNAQFGVADTAWLLLGPRKEAEKQLMVAGRDMESQTMTLTFDAKRCRWEYLGDSEALAERSLRLAYNSSPVVKTIKSLLEEDNHASIKIDSSGLCAEVASRFGCCSLTPTQMGRAIRDVSNQLYEYDKIVCTLPTAGGRNGRLYGFRYETISPVESEQCTMIN